MNKKIIWGIVIGVILIVGVAYYVDKNISYTEDGMSLSKSDWKTYTNNKYGFQLQHPSDGKVLDVNVENGTNFFFTFESNGNRAIDIQVLNQENCLDTSTGDTPTKVRINNIEFIKYDISKLISGKETTVVAKVYCVVQNRKTYKIIPKILYQGIAPNLDADDFLNKIISSFKFTSPVVTSTTSKPSITVLSPNGGEKLKIGDTITIKYKLIGNIKPEYKVVLILEPGYSPIKGLSSDVTSYDWKVPEIICIGGDACGPLTPGSYKIAAALYDKNTCIGYCAPVDPPAKLLVSDESDATFTITN